MVEHTDILPKAELNPFMRLLGVRALEDYPDWYGIEGIKFIWHGEWADPTIVYKGKEFSCYYVEDTMWERFTHDDDDNFIPERDQDFDGFYKYMLENKDEVYELCEAITGANIYE